MGSSKSVADPTTVTLGCSELCGQDGTNQMQTDYEAECSKSEIRVPPDEGHYIRMLGLQPSPRHSQASLMTVLIKKDKVGEEM